ncbi:MAG TPA: 4a-hydroxytetrahydrobiopterin dehydratase [Robiginitalea sp.]|nr:4a-hydroxytetrahydrobiopterin dehydratase [Robiginitalea sp.]
MEKLTARAIEEALKELPGWEYRDQALVTVFEFADFKEAFTAMSRIAFECEAQQHHPDWSNVYNELEIRLTTHDAGGVTEKDFRLAQTIETLLAAS